MYYLSLKTESYTGLDSICVEIALMYGSVSVSTAATGSKTNNNTETNTAMHFKVAISNTNITPVTRLPTEMSTRMKWLLLSVDRTKLGLVMLGDTIDSLNQIEANSRTIETSLACLISI